MLWIGISGSWRNVNAEMERDVRDDIRLIIQRGDAMVTGGALGVDYLATDEAIKHNPACDRIKIILPVSLDLYAAHLRNRVAGGVVSAERVEPNLELLTRIQSIRPASLVQMRQKVCDEDTYYARNTEVIMAADELWAYRANSSMGTGDTIDKASAKNIPVRVKTYQI